MREGELEDGVKQEPLEGVEGRNCMTELIRIPFSAVLDCQGQGQKQRAQQGGCFDNSGKIWWWLGSEWQQWRWGEGGDPGYILKGEL